MVPAPWQRHPLTQLLVAIVGVAPLYAISILSSVQAMISGDTPALAPGSSLLWSLVYVLVFGTWVVLLLYSVCGESLPSLQLQPGRMEADLKHGLALGGILLLLGLLFSAVASNLGQQDLPATNRAIATALAGDNLLLLIWLGPVVWLQAALIEELYRVFLLTRLWRVWPSRTGLALVVFGSSLLFGLGHAYQGPLGMLGTGLIGLVLGWHYLRHGRFLPLLIAHGLYDNCALLGMVLLVRHGLL